MYSINLSEEQVKQIIGEGDKNPLYKNILKTYLELSPIITIESLYNKGMKGFYISSLDSEVHETTVTSKHAQSIRVVDGIAPTKQAVKRTVLEYKILHLLKANGIKQGDKYIIYDTLNNELDISFKIKSTLSVDCLDKARDFTRNYKDILMEYFKMM